MNVKKYGWLILSLVFLHGCGTLGPSQPTVLAPQASFDADSARVAMEPTGTAVIKGTACVVHRVTNGGGIGYASYRPIVLYPVSPYLEEWVKLMHEVNKAKPGRYQFADPQFKGIGRGVTANAQGDFQFSRLKAGSYYLIATMDSYANGSNDVYLGSEQTGPNVITDYHATHYFNNNYSDILDKFVTVKDGETVAVSLSPHPIAALLLGNNGGWPSILGCRH